MDVYPGDRNLAKVTGNVVILHVANSKAFQKPGRGKEARSFPAEHVYPFLYPEQSHRPPQSSPTS